MSEIVKILPGAPRSFFCGGREVLRTEIASATGECALAAHMREIGAALFLFAERELFPAAGAVWQSFAERGEGYRFSPHRFKATATIKESKNEIVCRWRVVLFVDGEEVFCRELPMRWSADGAYQKRAPFFRRRKKERRRQEIVPAGAAARKRGNKLNI